MYLIPIESVIIQIMEVECKEKHIPLFYFLFYFLFCMSQFKKEKYFNSFTLGDIIS